MASSAPPRRRRGRSYYSWFASLELWPCRISTLRRIRKLRYAAIKKAPPCDDKQRSPPLGPPYVQCLRGTRGICRRRGAAPCFRYLSPKNGGCRSHKRGRDEGVH